MEIPKKEGQRMERPPQFHRGLNARINGLVVESTRTRFL